MFLLLLNHTPTSPLTSHYDFHLDQGDTIGPHQGPGPKGSWLLRLEMMVSFEVQNHSWAADMVETKIGARRTLNYDLHFYNDLPIANSN